MDARCNMLLIATVLKLLVLAAGAAKQLSPDRSTARRGFQDLQNAGMT